MAAFFSVTIERMDKTRIAIIDDDPDLRDVFSFMLKSAGHEVHPFSEGISFLSSLKKEPSSFDLVLSDFHLPPKNGLEIYHEARQLGLKCPYLIITAFGDFDTAVKALKEGVSDYLVKPVDEEILLQKVDSYLRHPSPEQELVLNKLGKTVIAQSPSMKAIVEKLSRLADSKASILLTGESGTGKEVLSKMLHELSPRKKSAFIAVNVSAIPETLFEAEFFGYKKGAFTDAVRDHDGYVRAAERGTLFLDELGELRLSSQAKLLRLIEDRKVQPLGSREILPADIRIISATNKDIPQMIKDGNFREDLYYRLAVVSIHIPPLRDRVEDIIPLARYLLKELCSEEKKQFIDFTPQAQEKILAYSWPGNVRELKNRIYEAVLVSNQNWIDADDLNLNEAHKKSGKQLLSYEDAHAKFEKKYLVNLLRMTGGNINKVSEFSQLSRKTIYEMMKRHDLQPALFRRHYLR